MKATLRSSFTILIRSMATVLFSATLALGANVTLQWDANDPEPEGYRVFARESGASYNYDSPIWESDEASETTCTLIGLTEGTNYYFVVRAYDGDLESADSEEVSYTPAAATVNQAPVAEAGSSQSVYEEAAVTLDGSGSSDADGSIASYLWAQTGGTSVVLSNAATASASFAAPVVDLTGETLTFSLTVTDDEGESDTDTVTVSVLKSSSTDVDGDNVPDVLDLFPEDASEWADNDGDGIGDNADIDDDNDGMSDTWEETYGLNPLTDDADLDADGDGVSNIDEYTADSDPTTVPGNTAPDAPTIEEVSSADTVSLTPVLVTAAYFDADNDDHFKSQWQIGTDSDFDTLIMDKTSKVQLTAYEVGKMVLDVDTAYYWRVRFIDTDNGVSEWSETGSFITIAAETAGDANLDGIPDSQEVGDAVDVNEDGVADSLEGDIMSFATVEGQTIVGVEPTSEGITLVSVESIASDTITDQSVQLGFGLIGFRLYLADGVTTAAVKISFNTRVPADAQLYKYTEENGWQAYSNAVFAANRKSVTIVLVDGGEGDEDGVVNGVIVDPSGISYSTESDSAAVSSTTSDASSSGGGGCFIVTATGLSGTVSAAAAWMTMILLGMGFVLAATVKAAKADLK
ncbi:choice-of-anchor U domain-containing protein [uncultured Desulfosarcina sp.]|uniref:choice-of-anchor U domain-containing protein n=1 Tax=uncultured Desulfosarcina sp. TaxID=218289 RepID=UPI0029C80AEE|nr:choice-of-anchor U domain-containing protein [uncultured Desulfosarcina sp.]